MRHCGKLGKHLDFPIQDIASMIITFNTVKLKLLNPCVVESAPQSLSRLVEGALLSKHQISYPGQLLKKMEVVAL